ncbi:MAG: c-type cytochrome biogenesis protein CcsB [Desulfobulbaceae bacterium]|nr:c-type cytochrome biogenesis protein CcsB [Desulfobulbaceae bacterium]
MDSSLLFGFTMIAYILASAIYIGGLLFKTPRLGLAGTCLTWGGVAMHSVATLLRWQESYQIGAGHAPLTNMYESLVFFALCIALTHLFLEHRYKVRMLGAFVLPLAALSMAYASFSPRIDDSIKPLIPALQSNWLIAHVVTCFIGYGAFAVGGALGLVYLLKNSRTPKEEQAAHSLLPGLAAIDELIYKTLIFGFLWLSAGIITGAIWANEAWGTYWSWDPKETWSIITWFLYAITLHVRFTRGWSGTRIAWLSLVGFVAVLFTYFGVNFFLSGLHSYGSS